ncbi:MAG: ribosome silencing factor [Thermoanaerobaculia bacterium]|nr:ribosome silencing factor [Thermoanaerobaculia bacterium]
MPNDEIGARVRTLAEAALSKKADRLVILDVEKLTSIADYFVICSAASDRQADAISDAVEESLRKNHGAKPLMVEGRRSGRWMLLDYGDFILHIFNEETRRFYNLERLWGDAPEVTGEFVREVPVGEAED